MLAACKLLTGAWKLETSLCVKSIDGMRTKAVCLCFGPHLLLERLFVSHKRAN